MQYQGGTRSSKRFRTTSIKVDTVAELEEIAEKVAMKESLKEYVKKTWRRRNKSAVLPEVLMRLPLYLSKKQEYMNILTSVNKEEKVK